MLIPNYTKLEKFFLENRKKSNIIALETGKLNFEKRQKKTNIIHWKPGIRF